MNWILKYAKYEPCFRAEVVQEGLRVLNRCVWEIRERLIHISSSFSGSNCETGQVRGKGSVFLVKCDLFPHISLLFTHTIPCSVRKTLYLLFFCNDCVCIWIHLSPFWFSYLTSFLCLCSAAWFGARRSVFAPPSSLFKSLSVTLCGSQSEAELPSMSTGVPNWPLTWSVRPSWLSSRAGGSRPVLLPAIWAITEKKHLLYILLLLNWKC